jgi:hypothetical protein
MKIIAFIIALGALLVGIFFLFNHYIYQQKQADGTEVVPEVSSMEERYQLEAEGLAFTYKTGADGYTLEELPLLSETDPQPIRMIRIVPTMDWEDEQTRVAGEGSPSWMLTVYPNEQGQTAAEWSVENPGVSNMDFAIDTPEAVVINEREAVRYTIDGLYLAQVYVFAEHDYIFVVYAAYLDEMSPTYLDVPAWLASFEFTAGASVDSPRSTKIDVRVACESALAYMTFMSGEEADTFVANCINGEHPEVIERYIESLGVDGAII